MSHCFSPMAGIATSLRCPRQGRRSSRHIVSAQWQALLLAECGNDCVPRTGCHIVSAQWQALLRIHDLRRTLGSGHIVSAQWQALLRQAGILFAKPTLWSHCFSPMAGIATAHGRLGTPIPQVSHCFSPMAGIATRIVRAGSSSARRCHIVSAQWQALLQSCLPATTLSN